MCFDLTVFESRNKCGCLLLVEHLQAVHLNSIMVLFGGFMCQRDFYRDLFMVPGS